MYSNCVSVALHATLRTLTVVLANESNTANDNVNIGSVDRSTHSPKTCSDLVRRMCRP